MPLDLPISPMIPEEKTTPPTPEALNERRDAPGNAARLAQALAIFKTPEAEMKRQKLNLSLLF
jgi:hypothetical protein